MKNEKDLNFLRWFFYDLSRELGETLLRIRVLAMDQSKQVTNKLQAVNDLERFKYLQGVERELFPIVDEALLNIGFTKKLSEFDDDDKDRLKNILKCG